MSMGRPIRSRELGGASEWNQATVGMGSNRTILAAEHIAGHGAAAELLGNGGQWPVPLTTSAKEWGNVPSGVADCFELEKPLG